MLTDEMLARTLNASQGISLASASVLASFNCFCLYDAEDEMALALVTICGWDREVTNVIIEVIQGMATTAKTLRYRKVERQDLFMSGNDYIAYLAFVGPYATIQSLKMTQSVCSSLGDDCLKLLLHGDNSPVELGHWNSVVRLPDAVPDDQIMTGIMATMWPAFEPGLICMDFYNIRMLLAERPSGILYFSDGHGDNREVEALSNLLARIERSGQDLTVFSGHHISVMSRIDEIKMKDIHLILSGIESRISNNAGILVSHIEYPSHSGRIRVMLLSTR